jgi:hypothetical protein
MYLELPCDGSQGVGNRLLRATLGVERYVHIMPLQFKVWCMRGEKVSALRAELMKLSEDEPLPDAEKQTILEKIILELGQTEAVAIFRQADQRVMIFTSDTADEDFFLLEMHAQEAADGLRGLATELDRCKRNLSNHTSPV